MNNKAQLSIELLLIALAVMAGSIVILSYYTNVNDSITAMELLKVKVLEKMGELDYLAYIEKIEHSVDGLTINFNLSAKPSKVTCSDLGLSGDAEGTIKWLIREKTKFETINFSLNGINC